MSATGEFQQAEFAADLGKVHAGSAPSEYCNPREFFGRTYLTNGLRALLVGAAKRLSNAGGDPVVELQTNFGGGKDPLHAGALSFGRRDTGAGFAGS